MHASAEAARVHNSESLRGHFRPWALIHVPDFGAAFRFVYPDLLVASQNQAFIWNIPTAKLYATVHNTQMLAEGDTLGHIKYVEVSDCYVIICGSQQLRIFSKDVQGTLLYSIPASGAAYAHWTMDLSKSEDDAIDWNDTVLVPREMVIHAKGRGKQAFPHALDHVTRFDDFIAGKYLCFVRGFILPCI